MDENVILAEQEVSGFFELTTGIYGKILELFSFVTGETYAVVFDGNEYSVTAFDASDGENTYTVIGNLSIVNMGDNTNEPFVMYPASTDGSGELNATIIATNDTTTDTHTIAIYQIVSEEVGIVIKNYSGVPIEYKGVEKVMFNTADGGTQVFSKGQAVEGVEIALDFSGGDQTVNAPDGTLVKSAVIKKPDTLVAENIVKDVEIAGVVGTSEGGGSSLESGYYLIQYPAVIPHNYPHRLFTFKGDLYLISNIADSSSANYQKRSIYKLIDNTYSLVGTYTDSKSQGLGECAVVEHDGAVHFIGSDSKTHNTWDGETFAAMSNLPAYAFGKCAAVFNGSLYYVTRTSDASLYRLDGDTSTKICQLPEKSYAVHYLFVWDGSLYCAITTNLYRYDEGSNSFSLVTTLPNSHITWNGELVGDEVWYISVNTIYTFNMRTLTNTKKTTANVNTDSYVQFVQHNGIVRVHGCNGYYDVNLAIIEVK